jgi:hypothetical protein
MPPRSDGARGREIAEVTARLGGPEAAARCGSSARRAIEPPCQRVMQIWQSALVSPRLQFTEISSDEPGMIDRPRPLRKRSPRNVALAMASLAALASLLVAGCGRGATKPKLTNPRTYRMGFSGIPPRADFPSLLATLELMSRHSDVAIMSSEAPWESLLAGVRADSFVLRQQKPLADYYRAKGLRVWVYLDPANGLNRGGEANPLVAAGRSITEPEIQQLYRDYAVALDTLVRPDVFGVVLETNLIRAISPAPLYTAIRDVANAAAADIRTHDAAVKLSASVQVETAWGLLPPSAYQGVAADFNDFPFIEVLGLSSYPYFAWAEPESLPSNYYSRLVQGFSTPVAITEGGWTSESFSTVVGTMAKQRRYLVKQAELLDAARAIAVFQLTFTDLEIHDLSPPLQDGLRPFCRLGLVDSLLAPKPALSPWDSTRSRPLR